MKKVNVFQQIFFKSKSYHWFIPDSLDIHMKVELTNRTRAERERAMQRDKHREEMNEQLEKQKEVELKQKVIEQKLMRDW